MKKLLCLVMVVLLIVSLTACKNNEQPAPTITPVGSTAKFEVTTYLVEEWKDINENNETTGYNYILLVYTDGFYCHVENNDIKFLDTTERKPLTEAIDGATVQTINLNAGNKKGTCAYVTIKIPKLIDTRKINILVEGPATYDAEVSTKDEYIKKHGNDDGWYATLTSISTHTPTYQDVELNYKSETSGMLRLFDTGRSQYWYENVSAAALKDSKIIITMNVTPLKNTTIDDFVKGFKEGCYFVDIDENGAFKEAKLDDRLEFVIATSGNAVELIMQMKDGSDIANYDGKMPSAIIYNNNYLVHTFGLNVN